MIQGPKLVDMLISLYNQMDRICQECFDNSPNFKFLLNKAFEEEMNKTNLVSFPSSSRTHWRSCWLTGPILP